jgi:Mechanosensitive ion channel
MNLRLLKFPNVAFFVFLGFLCAPGLSAQIRPSGSDLPSDQQVIAFLTQSVAWYRQLSTLRQIATEPVDLLFLYDNLPAAAQVVQLSFDFARADASLATTSSAPRSQPGPVNGPSPDMDRFIQLQSKAEKEAAQTRERVEILSQQLLKAHRADRKKLHATLDETRSRLELLEAGSAHLSELVEFVRMSGADSSGIGNLASIIDDLARTVPEATNPTTVQPSTRNSDSSSAKPQGPGILGLAAELSALQGKLRAVDEQTRLTNNLATASESLRVPLLGLINKVVQSGDASYLQANDLHTLQQQKAQLDTLTLQLKTLSPAIVALDKQRVLLNAYKSHLGQWRAAVVNQYETAWKDLTLRLVIVAVIIAFLLFVGAIVGGATNRHVHDANRRRLILMVERVVIWSTVLLAGVFAFATNLSSLATFFGLLTAGVAVALQSVIVASLGYFVLIGKRGIRVGDRVQISGIAGEVIEIGLLQFQLREFNVESRQLTDNVVTFSNSFIFVSPATGLFRLKPENRSVRQPEDLEDSKVTASDT